MLTLDAVALTVALFAPQEMATGSGAFVDPRDQQSYPTVEIGGATWFARNLDYASPGSFCYDDDLASCARYGRLYRWEAALAACPSGWHVSTEYEWRALELALGLPWIELEDVENRGTDQAAGLKRGGGSGFDVQYGGWRRSEDGAYEARDAHAAFWTATESKLDRAWHRDIDTGDDQIWRSPVIKPYALSVRCVRNGYGEDDFAR